MALKQRDNKYRLEEMDTMYVSALLRLKIGERGIKIKRNDDRCQQFEQSQLFWTNQKVFYETLDGKERGETELHEPTLAPTFWTGIMID